MGVARRGKRAERAGVRGPGGVEGRIKLGLAPLAHVHGESIGERGGEGAAERAVLGAERAAPQAPRERFVFLFQLGARGLTGADFFVEGRGVGAAGGRAPRPEGGPAAAP
jgi:hypothetical protein